MGHVRRADLHCAGAAGDGAARTARGARMEDSARGRAILPNQRGRIAARSALTLVRHPRLAAVGRGDAEISGAGDGATARLVCGPADPWVRILRTGVECEAIPELPF